MQVSYRENEKMMASKLALMKLKQAYTFYKGQGELIGE